MRTDDDRAKGLANQERLRERRAKLGLVRVETWVPDHDRQRLLTYAAKLRKKHEKEVFA